MPGYVFMHADVTDPDGYEKFKSLASAAIADHGGRCLVRGGAMQPLEGQWRSRVVLLEFPTYAAALAFYNSDAYQGGSPGPLALIHGKRASHGRGLGLLTARRRAGPAIRASGLTWTAPSVGDVDDRDRGPDQRDEDYLGRAH